MANKHFLNQHFTFTDHQVSESADQHFTPTQTRTRDFLLRFINSINSKISALQKAQLRYKIIATIQNRFIITKLEVL